MISAHPPDATGSVSAAYFSDFDAQFPASDPRSFSYYERLHPWCIIRLLPNAQRITVARFRKRNDAEAHLKALRQLTPSALYEIMFDAETDRSP
jgi:hypothetical protein